MNNYSYMHRFTRVFFDTSCATKYTDTNITKNLQKCNSQNKLGRGYL